MDFERGVLNNLLNRYKYVLQDDAICADIHLITLILALNR